MFRSILIVSLLLTSMAAMSEPTSDIKKLVAAYGG